MIKALVIVLDAQATQINFVVGSHVWVEDPEAAWLEGEILQANGEEIKVKCSDKEVSLLEFIFNPVIYKTMYICKKNTCVSTRKDQTRCSYFCPSFLCLYSLYKNG